MDLLEMKEKVDQFVNLTSAKGFELRYLIRGKRILPVEVLREERYDR